MKWLVFIAGLLIGAGGTFATVVYEHMNWQEKDDTIIFPMKVFYEDDNDAMVFMSGTLTGPEVVNPNNTYTISCVKEEHECSISHVDQIGTNLIGRLEVAYRIPIAQWNASEVIASEDDINPFCQKTTITLDRKSKGALWLDVPINTASSACKNADKQVRKYTIEDAPGWKRLSIK